MLSGSSIDPSNPNPATIIFTLPIHNAGLDPYRCGSLRPGSMMAALSFIYGLHNLTGQFRQFGLRVLILDHCTNVLRIDQDLFHILSKGKLCNAAFGITDGSVIDAKSVVAVHTQFSGHVVAANRVTAPMKIQLTGSLSSSPRLSDKRIFPYVARMVPPDTYQMEVISKILERNGWSYVSVLYSNEPYGIAGYRTLRDMTSETTASCIGGAEALRDTSSKDDIKEALTRLNKVQGARVLVLIVLDMRIVLESLIEMDLASKYIIIGTDTWGKESIITDGIWEHFLGALTVSFRDAYHQGFLNWMSQLTFTNRFGIPNSWFDEFYQLIHRCQILNSPQRQTQYETVCANDLVIQPEQIKQYSSGLHEIAAAYSIADGLRRFRCGDDTFEECMADVENAREKLFDYTLSVNWEIPRDDLDPVSNFTLSLGDDKRYWDNGYTVYTIKEGNIYEMIGSSYGDEFYFNSSYMTYKDDEFSSRCPVNQVCDCTFDDSGPKPVKQSFAPASEPRNYFMYEESTSEEPLYTWPIWGIAVAVLSCIGIVIGLILFFYFLFAYPTRGGTTILAFMMMIGVFGIYGINFAFIMPASAATCGAREFVLGVVYAIVFAALLIKAIDDWRFKDSDYHSKRYRGMTNPCLLVSLALGIVLVQCIIPIEWLVLRNPSASLMKDATNRHDWMCCDPHDFYDISLVLSMVFVVFIIILTAIFAALAWDSDSNHFESRWIFVSCVSTAGCFLVWMIVSTNAGPPYRDPAVAIANFVNATALLIFLPFRKLVLLIQYNSEEEKYALTNGAVESNVDMYSTVYNNQVYEADSPTIESKTLPAEEY